jgi:hypothetical protein
MLPRHGRWGLFWSAGVWLLAVLSLAGCAEVKVIDATPAVYTPEALTSPLPKGPVERNLVVLAVDFDPPLEYEQLLLRRQPISLLVAIENVGAIKEQDITVRAQLSTLEDPEFLLTQGASISSIAPGEIQVVRFGQLGAIPLHKTYSLEVIVDAVQGESDLTDNRKAYDIQIQPVVNP